VAPTNYKFGPRDTEAQDANLELEYVHGYRCFDVRNNIGYCDDGDNILYFTAAVGIIHNIASNTQKFVFENSDDIISLAVRGQICASAEIGPKPTISLWSNETQEVYGNLAGILTKGVLHMAFDNAGEKLAAVGMDAEKTVVVFDVKKWKAGEIHHKGYEDPGCVILRSPGPRLGREDGEKPDQVMHMLWNNFDDTLVFACMGGVYFGKVSGKKLNIKKGTGWADHKKFPSLCVAYLGNDAVTGTINGTLVHWPGQQCKKAYPGCHRTGINAMTTFNKETFITGGNDGCVKFWTTGFNCTRTVDLIAAGCHVENARIRALAKHPKINKIMIGTRGSEIIEVDAENKFSYIIKGHYDHELWGLCMHPKKNEFITVGEDFYMAKWSLDTHKQIKHFHLQFQSTTLVYNSTGTKFVVGCKNGRTLIFDDSDPAARWAVAGTLTGKRFKEICELKFSPNDEYLAVGGLDSQIYIYDGKTFKQVSMCKGHHVEVQHVDFSLDGQFLHSNDAHGSLYYFECKTGKLIPDGATKLRDETWGSYTTPYGWNVAGIRPPFAKEGDEIFSVDRSKSGKLCVTADGYGKLKLFKYPQPNQKSGFQRFVGHSDKVTNCKFSRDDKYLVSLGGWDKAIFQWRVVAGDAEDCEYDDSDFNLDEFRSDKVDNNAYGAPETKKAPASQAGGLFEVAEEDTGDQFMAVKPFLGQVNHSIPDEYKKQDPLDKVPPETNLTPVWINGYRCFDARQTAKWLNDTDNICFVSAALGVTMNIPAREQKFFMGHDED
jgi:WD40 repeat protein